MIRTCPLCEAETTALECCGIDLTARRPWRMTRERIARVHAVARGQKGLDEETYRLRLLAVGVESSKQLTRPQFLALMQGLAKLPDRPRPGGGRGRADAR